MCWTLAMLATPMQLSGVMSLCSVDVRRTSDRHQMHQEQTTGPRSSIFNRHKILTNEVCVSLPILTNEVCVSLPILTNEVCVSLPILTNEVCVSQPIFSQIANILLFSKTNCRNSTTCNFFKLENLKTSFMVCVCKSTLLLGN